MGKRVQYAGLLCLPAMFLFVIFGLYATAGFMPPPLPSATAEQTAAMYRDNRVSIILGMALMVFSTALFIPFFAVVADQMRRMRGAPRSLAYAQLISGALGVTLVIIPLMMWVACAFRPERNPEITQMMNDTGWIIFTMPFGPALVQAVSLGLAILADEGEGDERVLPRWMAYLCFWLGFMVLPAGLIGFFKSGPFGWNGFISFWLPIFALAIAFTPILLGLFKAINRQYSQPEVAAH